MHCLGDERKTCASGHGYIPFTLFSIFILVSEKLKEYGDDFRKCDLSKVLGSVDLSIEEALRSCVNCTRARTNESSTAYLLRIDIIALEISFLLSN